MLVAIAALPLAGCNQETEANLSETSTDVALGNESLNAGAESVKPIGSAASVVNVDQPPQAHSASKETTDGLTPDSTIAGDLFGTPPPRLNTEGSGEVAQTESSPQVADTPVAGNQGSSLFDSQPAVDLAPTLPPLNSSQPDLSTTQPSEGSSKFDANDAQVPVESDSRFDEISSPAQSGGAFSDTNVFDDRAEAQNNSAQFDGDAFEPSGVDRNVETSEPAVPSLSPPSNPSSVNDLFDDTGGEPSTASELDELRQQETQPRPEQAPNFDESFGGDLLPPATSGEALPPQPKLEPQDLGEPSLPLDPFAEDAESKSTTPFEDNGQGSVNGTGRGLGESGLNREPAALGVRVVRVSPQAKRRWGIALEDGAVIHSLHTGSPAERAGLPVGGVITHVDSQEINSPEDLVAFLESKQAGDQVDVVIEGARGVVRKAIQLGRPSDTFIDSSSRDDSVLPMNQPRSEGSGGNSALEELEREFTDSGTAKGDEIEEAEFRPRQPVVSSPPATELQRKVLELEVELDEMRQRVQQLEAALRSR